MTIAPKNLIPEGPYQLMPPLTDDEFDMLKSDIRIRGVLSPIVLDENMRVLDGHHRLACIASLELENPDVKIPYNTDVRRGLSEEQKREVVIALNLKRRHLTHEQRLTLMVQLRSLGKTVAEVGELAGVSTATAWRRLQEAESSGISAPPEYTRGRDGKLYPTNYVPASYMGYTELRKEERHEARVLERSTLPANVPAVTDMYDIFLGDIRDREAIIERVGRGTVDAIISDPPYPREYVPLLEDMAYIAAAVLKPGRPLVAMLGHAYMPQYYELLGKYLTYHWTIANILGGANSVQHAWKTFVNWKPMLVFTNGPAELPNYFMDTVTSPGPDKEFHVWGQDVRTFEILAYRFTNQGDLILDPFLGGGTTGVGAIKMNRRIIGFDNDPECISNTLHRLSDPELVVGSSIYSENLVIPPVTEA